MKICTLTFLMGSFLFGTASWAQIPTGGGAPGANFRKEFFDEGRRIAHQLDGFITIELPREWRMRDGVNLRSGFNWRFVAACPKNVVPESCIPPKALSDGWKTLDIAARGGLALTTQLGSLGRGFDQICMPQGDAYARLNDIERRLARWGSHIFKVSSGRISVITPRTGMNGQTIPASALESASESSSAPGSANFRNLPQQKRQLARDAIKTIMAQCGYTREETPYEMVVDACRLANCGSPKVKCSLASCCETWPSHCPREQSASQ